MEEQNNTRHKCKRRGCSAQANSRCAAVLCNNWVCTNCYEEKVLTKFGLAALPSQNDIPLVACSKKCYQNAMKDISGEGRRAWDSDTPTREYQHSSEAMLIDWLLVHGNYAKWKGNNAGISKREIQKEIADAINRKGAEMGIQRGRTPEQVGAKISWIESKFRETKQWVENTGQRIREEIGEQSFKEKVEKERFKHFYTLEPIIVTSRPPKNRKGSMENVVANFNNSRKDDRDFHLLELEERIRHNREMELIEKGKARVTSYDCIQKNMDVFRNSRTMYDELRQTMTLEQIAHSLPNCIRCFDFSVMSEEDRQKFAKYYNDWAVSIGIPERIDLTFI
ncbi:hypothetical protein IV203_028496 [Nitzschia inconspicua]|uniref:Uncharacterized protein n=1 Tax=Nitzschia inconspicua TaxID=303405 RepID=A0A9K3LRX4_9STRA|nr:hypothetical protein IV203_028496 [Nitzschia inconspicua]